MTDDLAQGCQDATRLARDLDAEFGARSLREYVKLAWAVLYPDTPFVDSWAVGAICEHLEAVERDQIADLLITAPPRQGKSNIVVVLYPTWAWIRQPWLGWIFDTCKMSLTLRDSLRRRQLMESAWFRDRWGNVFTLLREQHAKSRIENTRRGSMLATSVESGVIGEGGHRLVADDLHDPEEADANPDNVARVVDHWTQTMSTRRNKYAKRILQQQRINVDDVAGDCVARGYVHLNLPQKFEADNRCRVFLKGKVFFEDPREREGELLNPALFDEQQNREAEDTLDEFHYAAQHQQRPVPREGGVIKEDWLQCYWTELPPRFDQVILSVDCSFKDTKGSDYVAGTAWGSLGPDVYLLPWGFHERLDFPRTVERIKETCEQHPELTAKLIEDKANGTAVVSVLKTQVKGIIAWDPGRDSKLARASAVSYRFRAGNVLLPHPERYPWVKKYQIELSRFPRMKHDDWVDSTTQALIYLDEIASVSFDGVAVGVEREDGASPWRIGSYT